MEAPAPDFATRLLDWFDRCGRHDLPWQHPRTPYRVWVSEIMLQQTQVQTAAPYFERFMSAFPTLPALAQASLDQVLAQWSGLGYYARARNLHQAARACIERHAGELPRDTTALEALPGIGRSTAAAIMAQAWGERCAILDGNVKRVLARYHGVPGWPNSPAVQKQLWLLAERHLPAARLADYTQAQMDFGATLCTRLNPACAICVLQPQCVAWQQGRVAELPTPRPGKPLPQREALVLLARNAHGEVLMQRRPPTGIWASLWSLPQADDPAALREWFERHLQGDFDSANALDPIQHAFTHFRLRLQPVQFDGLAMRAGVGDNDDLRWMPQPGLQSIGIPAPIRKLLGA